MTEIRQINADEYVKIIKSDTKKVIIMDFFATWCNPCKMLAPVLEELAKKSKDVEIYKIDVDENSALADDLDIHSVPTLLIYKDGKIQKQVMGFQPMASLERMIEAVIK